ncbi:MAG TPA: hypothetical protein VEI94_01810 [Candidatus Bathyarchaeia archaeon]|nr:hypothetical protein [Candidatus Bathyarchaeia archaeon]
MKRRDAIVPFCLCALLAVDGSTRTVAAAVVQEEDVSRQVFVRDVAASADGISGVLVNRSGKIIRDVRLLIRHSWVWTHEQRPGEESPGESYFTTVPNDIPAGSSVRFTYRPRGGGLAADKGTGGHFDTSVDVMGFTEVTMPGERSGEGGDAPHSPLTVEPPTDEHDGSSRGADPRGAPGLPSGAPPSTRRVDPL